jgi:hypothetical protein
VTLIKETQGFETALFRSYFRQRGLFLLRGARPLTTVNKAEDTATPRFFRVKGSRVMPMATEMPCTSSVLQGNKVFIPRPAGAKYFYMWCGSRSTGCDQDVGANLLFSLGRHGGAPPPMCTLTAAVCHSATTKKLHTHHIELSTVKVTPVRQKVRSAVPPCVRPSCDVLQYAPYLCDVLQYAPYVMCCSTPLM